MSAWRTDGLDDGVTVLLRSKYGDPLEIGCKCGDRWEDPQGYPVSGVSGWMHLEDAAKILDEYSKPLLPAC